MNDRPTRYRLRGEVAGLVRTYALDEGRHLVGSTSECEVVLPVRGVSRRHAVVTVGPDGVSVADEGSRNGTFVRGTRLHHGAQVSPGDGIGFGAVTLQLERVLAEDAELGIDVLSPRSAEVPPPGSTETVDVLSARVPSPEAGVLVFPPAYVCGSSPAIAAMHAQMKPLVQGDLPVLVLGETGVGKELVSRALHLSSRRRAGPFVAVNCAAIPADVLESEMFGHVRGAFTGAVADKKGLFAQANGGTILLDEIGEMPLPLQPKLLRALQEREIRPVGGLPTSVDVRVVAATNSDLLRRMEDGAFRRDLYYRVAGFPLRVPPLRERREDVPAIAEAFVRVFAREAGKSVRGISRRALNALVAYAWPGNVRELEHEIRRLVYVCDDGQAIESPMLAEHVAAALGERVEDDDPAAPQPLAGGSLDAQVDALQRRLVREALAATGGNRSEAARRLGVSRNGLAIKMERLGISD